MSTKRQALLMFAAGQLCFVTGLAICILIKPLGLGANSGISYYGTFAATFIPYALAVLGTSIFIFLTANYLNDPDLRIIKIGFVAFALLGVLIAFTPYSAGTVLNYIHTIAGTILFSLQLVLSFWMVYMLKFKVWAFVLAIIELAAGMLAAIYVLPKHGLLIQAQIVFQLAFGALMIYGLNILLIEAPKS